MHGINDNSVGFQSHGFNYFVESDTFIVIYPEAPADLLLGVTTWNYGVGALGVYLATGVNDIGFVSALIDSVVNKDSIDLSRIYAAGHSLGGFIMMINFIDSSANGCKMEKIVWEEKK